jgi:hypothetical protein
VSCPSFKFIGVPVLVPLACGSGQEILSSFKLRGVPVMVPMLVILAR